MTIENLEVSSSINFLCTVKKKKAKKEKGFLDQSKYWLVIKFLNMTNIWQTKTAYINRRFSKIQTPRRPACKLFHNMITGYGFKPILMGIH